MTQINRNWIGSIRLALAIFGLPYTVCTSGIRSSVFCSSDQSFRTGACIFNGACNLCTTHIHNMLPLVSPHVKSRRPQYPGSEIKRLSVPDDKVDWSRDWPEYIAVDYTHPSVIKRPSWADPNIGDFSARFNVLDGAVDRTSFEGNYRVEQGKPLNPRGRTGLAGRGLLGRWGPNHAADPIVTRWKVDGKNKKVSHPLSKRPILQFVSIKRRDCGEWAIPGGMVDPRELVSLTLQREFSEEALNSLAATPAEKAKIHERITKLFSSPGFQVYKGYVDDPRNTDNAWIETVAVNFHDEAGTSVGELPLQAGDDAGQVKWVDLDSSVSLYASHSQFLAVVANERRAHW